jgi:hypothetical protein
MPPVPVGGTELRPVVMLVASDYLPRLLLLLFLSFGAAIIYIFTHTHTHTRTLENLCLYTPVPPHLQPQ